MRLVDIGHQFVGLRIAADTVPQSEIDFRHPALNAPTPLDEIGAALGDHDGRRVGVAADDLRHHRGVDHAEALEAVNPQLRIDHGHRVLAHLAGAGGVIGGAEIERTKSAICASVWAARAGIDLGALVLLHRRCLDDATDFLGAADDALEIVVMREEIGNEARRVLGARRFQR